jgi:hypothetical protein
MSADLLSRPTILVALVDANGVELTARVQATHPHDVYQVTQAGTCTGWLEFTADGTPIEQRPLAEPCDVAVGARLRMHCDHLGRVRLMPEMLP